MTLHPGSRFPVVCLLAAALLGGCASGTKRSGAYYKDDGPGANPPAGLANLPDAVPRSEPLHRYANRPYQVFGREYVPFATPQPFRERGMASWYGRRFHGQRTSSGEVYDMYSMSAAHPRLPIPSYVRVTNLANGRSVVLRVNDRGPFHGERVIDLSYAAAYKLGFADAGSARVEVESIVPGTGASAPAAAAPPAETPPERDESVPQGVYLQLGAFASRDNAESFRQRVLRELAWLAEPLRVVNSGNLYKVHLGPYRSRGEAKPVATRIGSELDFTPLTVER